MLQNPVKAVAPLLVLVHLDDGKQFDPQHTEAYHYETIGGNHSRIALQVRRKYIVIVIDVNKIEYNIFKSELYCVDVF